LRFIERFDSIPLNKSNIVFELLVANKRIMPAAEPSMCAPLGALGALFTIPAELVLLLFDSARDEGTAYRHAE
jgi:hypothetical protein